MKKTMMLLAALVMILTGCRKNDNEVLSTIPKDTGFVAVINVEKLNANLGNKMENGKPKFDEATKQLFSMMGSKGNDVAKAIENNEFSLDYTKSVAAFELKGNSIATFFVDDAGKFKAFVEKEGNTKFTTKGNVEYCDTENTYLIGNQVWVAQSYPAIDASDIESLTSLPEGDSLNDTEYASTLTDSNAEIEALVSFKYLAMAGGNNMVMNFGLNTAYDDATYMAASICFEEAKALCDIKILNSKFEIAKSNIKTQPISKGVVNSYEGKGNIFYAFAVTGDQLSAILKQYSNLVQLPADVSSALGKLEGTIVGSMNSDNSSYDAEPCFGLLAEFKDASSAQIVGDYIKSSLPLPQVVVEQTGNRVYVHSQTQRGSDISSVADVFNGCSVGVAISPEGLIQDPKTAGLIKMIKLQSRPDSKEACVITIDTKKGQNALLSILQLAAEAKR